MNEQRSDAFEAVGHWLEMAGFHGDTSAIVAGLHDIADSAEKIQFRCVPRVLQLESSQYGKALDIIIDWIVELEHIRRHADDTLESLAKVREYLEHSREDGE